MKNKPTVQTADTLDWLDVYLCSNEAPPDGMQLSDLDGFLTGLALNPELIVPSEWLPHIWGGDEPRFKDETQAQMVLGAIMERYNQILLQIEQDAVEPIFWVNPKGEMIAMDWAEGFVQAMSQAQSARSCDFGQVGER